jgi:phosphoglycerol transferase MdoB-like AlkP superfamily enzyme
MHRLASAADLMIKRLYALVRSYLTIYIVSILLKLLYFNYQTGLHRVAGTELLTTLGSIFVIISFAFLLKNKNARRYVLIIDLLLSFLMFSDLAFYRYFNDLLSIPLLFQAGSLGDIKSSIMELLHPWDLIFFADMIIFPVAQRLQNGRKYNLADIGKRSIAMALAFCMSGILMVYAGTSELVQSQPTILQTFYDKVYVAQNIGLLNYHAADAYRFVEQNLNDKEELSQQKKDDIFEFFDEKKKVDNQKGKLFGAAKGKNVIVIQVEALQQFVINKKINGQEITPNLNKLISKSIYFNNYYYETAGGGTSDAEFDANVSLYPMKEGAVYIRKSGNYYYSLAKKLKDNGYSSMAMHGYKPGFWNRSVMYDSLGFDKFYSNDSYDESDQLGMGISDKSFLSQSFDKLKLAEDPYFAFLITLSSHFPFNNDKSHYSSFDVGGYKDTLLGNYLEAIHYTDEALGEFIDKLQSSGMMDNTVLAIYGDHLAIPKDNMKELASFMGKDSLSELEWQKLQKVPMIIHIPGSKKGKVVKTAGGGVDFLPTLLHIAGIDTSNLPYMGQDLINAKKGFVVLRNGSFITDNTAYIANSNNAYDLKTWKAIPPEAYAQDKDLAEKYLDYSDTILDFDLLDDIKAHLESQKP